MHHWPTIHRSLLHIAVVETAHETAAERRVGEDWLTLELLFIERHELLDEAESIQIA